MVLVNQSSVMVKVCGVTQLAQAETIAAWGVNYLGFISVPSSPRYRSPEDFAAILGGLTTARAQGLRCVGVCAQMDWADLRSLQDQVGFDVLQFHGQESPDFCAQVRDTYPQVAVWKALRIRDQADLDQAQPYETIVDGLVLDAYHPHLLGGTGQTLDWSILQTFQPSCPWLLAGGLTPENVAEAVRQVQPWGVDVSSGVERSPGDKDLQAVQHFLAAARSALTPTP